MLVVHRRLHFIIALAVLFSSLAVTSAARAQTITVAGEASLPRMDASGQQIPKRPLTLSPEAINLEDCRQDQRIRFPLEMAGFTPNAILQAWASTGADCSIPSNRMGEDAACWPLVEAIPLQMNIDVDIPVRAILSRNDDASVCGSVDLTKIAVQFLMFESSSQTAMVKKQVAVIADTIGPIAPNASVSPGNGRARVEVRPSGELQSLTSVSAYCEKSASPSACTALELVPGREPDPARECGSVVGNTGTVFFTNPLANGENHVVAVAGRDAFGNLGPLSTVTCTTPSPDAETRVQSLDEPTGCAMSAPGGHPRGAAAFGLALVGIALARLRRRDAQ